MLEGKQNEICNEDYYYHQQPYLSLSSAHFLEPHGTLSCLDGK